MGSIHPKNATMTVARTNVNAEEPSSSVGDYGKVALAAVIKER